MSSIIKETIIFAFYTNIKLINIFKLFFSKIKSRLWIRNNFIITIIKTWLRNFKGEICFNIIICVCWINLMLNYSLLIQYLLLYKLAYFLNILLVQHLFPLSCNMLLNLEIVLMILKSRKVFCLGLPIIFKTLSDICSGAIFN